MPKREELTVKERRLVQGVIEGKSNTQAAIDAGYSPRSAYSIAGEVLRKPEVAGTLREMMESAGLDNFYLLHRLKGLIDAENKGLPDWTARARGIDLALKLQQAYSDSAGSAPTIIFSTNLPSLPIDEGN